MASGKSKGCIIALAVVGVIGVLTTIGIYWVFQKAKDVVEGYAGAFGASPEMIEEAKALNNEFPFTAPEDGIITEPQMEKFIEIKNTFADKIKSHADAFKALKDKQDNDLSGFKEYSETLSLLSDIRRDFIDALKEHKMSPKEYRFLSTQVFGAYYGSMGQMIAQHNAEASKEISEAINEQNVELFNRYRDQINHLETAGFEFWGWGTIFAE